MNQSEYETLMMAHDNSQRELSDIKRLMDKDKHELIKANIELNKRVQELEELLGANMTEVRVQKNAIKRTKAQNKRYRDMLVKIFKIVQNHQITKISDEDYADAATLLYKWIYDTGVIDHEKHFSEVHGHDEFDSYQINLLLKKHTSKKSSKALEGESDA